MRHVIGSHKIEPRAMYRKDIGWIGFEWGTEGEAPPQFKDHAEFRKWQKSGRRPFDKGGHGIAHIIAKRNWEGEYIEEFLGQKGIEVAYKLIQVIARGSLKIQGTTAHIEWHGYLVILRKRKIEKQEYWLITGYEKPAKYKYVPKSERILESTGEWGGVDDPALHLRISGLHSTVQIWERQTQAGRRLTVQKDEVNQGWLYDL